MFGCFLNVLVNYEVISRMGPETKRLTISRAATQSERGDHGFCLSRLHFTNTDPTRRERARGSIHDLLTRSRAFCQLSYRALKQDEKIMISL